LYFLRKIWNPEIFQGGHQSKNYFEGWYFKLIDKAQKNTFAIIPGISYGKTTQDRHAFIQYVHASSGESQYIRYDISDFAYSPDTFQISIGDNKFTKESLSINISNSQLSILGDLSLTNIVSLPKTLFNPGIMGPFSFIPFMECYHGIVNLHEEIRGSLRINGEQISFDGGYGYIEKDWGKSFPESWVWLQSNHFKTDQASFLFSLAKIPWLGKHFPGFISFLRYNGTIYRFATYTGARIVSLTQLRDGLEFQLQDHNFLLTASVECASGYKLKAPKNGLMEREISECINARVHVLLYNKNHQLIFEGHGSHTGLEIAGDIFQYWQDAGVPVMRVYNGRG
jgi:tocopherol cyclase